MLICLLNLVFNNKKRICKRHLLKSCIDIYIFLRMERKNCPGCKTHFEQGTLLPPEGLSIELKNYQIPLKDQSHKLKLLKTIVSFLNSKGGTIYIGAVDDTRQVVGVQTSRKQQDNFRIFIQQLTDRIQPKVDLTDKEDIVVQFVPVVNKGKFSGKHLIKIIVKQGNPAELYCFTRKIQLQAVNDKKIDEYQIVSSYIRLNAGNIKELKGYQLVQEAKSKAAKPHGEYNCFHQDCNPQPLCMTIDILKLGFSNIFKIQTRQILEQWFQMYLTEINIVNPIISFDQENHMIVVELQSKEQFTKAEQFVSKNIKQLNTNLEGICNFEKKDKFLDCILFENTMKNEYPPVQQEISKQTKNKIKKFKDQNNERKIKIEEAAEIKREKRKHYEQQQQTSDLIKFETSKQEEKPKKIKIQTNAQGSSQKEPNSERLVKNVEGKKKQENSNKKQHIQHAEKKEKNAEKNKYQNSDRQKQQNMEKQKEQNAPSFATKKYSFTFTHINPSTRNDFRNFLDKMVKCKKNFEVYKNTIEIFLPDQQKYEEYYEAIILHQEQLCQFGFKKQIYFGVNTGIINILNYDKSKSKAIVGYLRNLIGKELQEITPELQGNRHFISILLNKPAACNWLDKLLEDKGIKSFQIPGAEKSQKPKIKIHLMCHDPVDY